MTEAHNNFHSDHQLTLFWATPLIAAGLFTVTATFPDIPLNSSRSELMNWQISEAKSTGNAAMSAKKP